MTHVLAFRRFVTIFTLSATFILTACGGGGTESESPTADTPAVEVASSSSSSPATQTARSSVRSSSSVSSSAFQAASSASSTTTQQKVNSPTSLHPTAISATWVTLTWEPPTDLPVAVYRLTRNGDIIGTTQGGNITYTDLGLSPEHQYTFRVQSGDGAGNWSPLSMGVSIRTAPAGSGADIPPPEEAIFSSSSTPSGNWNSSISNSNSSAHANSSHNAVPDNWAPTTPTGLTATQVKDTTIDLNWQAASDNVAVTLYRVMRDGEVIGIASGFASDFLDMNLTPNTEYTYRIQAGDAAGNWSALSTDIKVKTTTPAAKGGYLRWSHPRERENGLFLELDEIGGYELRYRQHSLDSYKSIIISGSSTNTYNIEGLATNLDFEIAAFDTFGLYSEFIAIAPD